VSGVLNKFRKNKSYLLVFVKLMKVKEKQIVLRYIENVLECEPKMYDSTLALVVENNTTTILKLLSLLVNNRDLLFKVRLAISYITLNKIIPEQKSQLQFKIKLWIIHKTHSFTLNPKNTASYSLDSKTMSNPLQQYINPILERFIGVQPPIQETKQNIISEFSRKETQDAGSGFERLMEKSPKFISDLFKHTLCTRNTCNTCSDYFERCNDDHTIRVTYKENLLQSIDEMNEKELITRKCNTCLGDDATREYIFRNHPPQNLMFRVNIYKNTLDKIQKIQTPIKFPNEINSNSLFSDSKNKVYYLHAVVYHHGGTLTGGHYTTTIFNGGQKQITYEDQRVGKYHYDSMSYIIEGMEDQLLLGSEYKFPDDSRYTPYLLLYTYKTIKARQHPIGLRNFQGNLCWISSVIQSLVDTLPRKEWICYQPHFQLFYYLISKHPDMENAITFFKTLLNHFRNEIKKP
jgi:hypothetical protein